MNTDRKLARKFAGAVVMVAALGACAPSRPIMSIMSEQEVRECEAQGGSVQPAYALHQYVCFFSGSETASSPSVTTERPKSQAKP